ncbi:DNA polymerase III subunit delta [Corynebacterium mendelii]|uniref:DNA polymerase III subunit delta n=1 Tax=Corynebacterium mendelii TaxID=2765362 RepID=UPI002ED1F301
MSTKSFPPVHLILGDEAFLAERTRHRIVTEARKTLPKGADMQISLLSGRGLEAGVFAEATSPSLFGDERIIALTEAEETNKDTQAAIVAAAADPAPGVVVIIQHKNGQRGKPLANKLKKIAETHTVAPLKQKDKPGFVKQEFASHKVNVTPDVVHAVLTGVGSDLRELASAVSQLCADTGGNVTVETVRDYYVGTAEISGFEIADLACAGKTARAVAATRRALQLGHEPVMLAGALSRKVAGIARLYNLQGRVDSYALAAEVGMPPWKVEQTVREARTWSGDAVSKAVIEVAELTADVRGRSQSAPYALERSVTTIARLAGG